MIVQLFRDGKEIIASDGIMYIDGRINAYNVRQKVLERNQRYSKNFPHKVCDSYRIYAKDGLRDNIFKTKMIYL